MSVKRFTLEHERIQEIDENGKIKDIFTDDEVVELLNSLSEENEQLRKRVEKLQSILHIVECCDKDE